MATVGIVFMRHVGEIRKAGTIPSLCHPAHPCNTSPPDPKVRCSTQFATSRKAATEPTLGQGKVEKMIKIYGALIEKSDTSQIVEYLASTY
jgi:hypothetical protein